jgi:hypothetical protein
VPTGTLAADQTNSTNVTDMYSVLWNGASPSWIDLKQGELINRDRPRNQLLTKTVVAVLDCWFVAASLAVVITSPAWVTNMLYFPNGTVMAGLVNPSSPLAIATVFDPNTHTPYNFSTTVAKRSATEDTPGGIWWHSAITQSVSLMAASGVSVDGFLPDGGVDPSGGSGYKGLSLLTPYPSTRRDTANYTSIDEFFSDLSKGYWTPIVVSTWGNVGTTTPFQIGANHDYAVMSSTDYGNGTRTVTLRNPWGRTEAYDVEDLWDNIEAVGYLTDWNYLSWPGS